MKMLALTAAFVAVAALATPAAAQTWQDGRVYGGLGYTQYDFDDAEVGGVTGRVGYKFHPNFAVEGEGTIGTSDDENAELDNAWGAYGVGILPLGSNFDLLGRVGYQTVEVDGTGPVADVEADGLAYGVGANWRVTDRFGVRGDYTRLDGDDDAEGDAISLTGTLNF
jgi:outer membrane immunogenic protein